MNTCGDFEYTHKLSDGNAAPSFIILDSSSRTFTVSSSSPADRGTYLLKVHGKTDGSASNPEGTSDIFELKMECSVNSISTSDMQSEAYLIETDGIKKYPISTFTQSPACEFAFSYSAKLKDGSLLPDVIKFDDTLKEFEVSTNNLDDAGLYEIVVTASLTDDTGPKSESFNWSI